MTTPNVTTSIPTGAEGVYDRYSEVLAAVVNSSAASPEGCTIGQMSARLSLAALLEAAKDADNIELSQKQHALMKSLLEKHTFPMISPDLTALGAEFGIE